MKFFTETKEQRELREYWDTMDKLGKDLVLPGNQFSACSYFTSIGINDQFEAISVHGSAI